MIGDLGAQIGETVIKQRDEIPPFQKGENIFRRPVAERLILFAMDIQIPKHGTCSITMPTNFTVHNVGTANVIVKTTCDNCKSVFHKNSSMGTRWIPE